MMTYERLQLQDLPAMAAGAFRSFEQALNTFTFLPDLDNSMTAYWRWVAIDEARTFDDRMRCYISYGEFTSRETVRELVRHRRILIQIGLLERKESFWNDR